VYVVHVHIYCMLRPNFSNLRDQLNSGNATDGGKRGQNFGQKKRKGREY
jgi:hypothetical protein